LSEHQLAAVQRHLAGRAVVARELPRRVFAAALEAHDPSGRASVSGVIHHAAATGFARSAAAYERARPGYPAAAVDLIVAALPGPRVLDLAAGGGKLTRELVERELDVVAVEPVAEMRALIAPPARVLDGTAEAIPLADASVDAVTVAQAFHWFDLQRALPEIHRVLRPGGVLVLIWNRRRVKDPVQRDLQRIMEPHRSGTPAHRVDAWRAELVASDLFGPLAEQILANEQVLDADGLAEHISSISFVAALDEAPRAALLDEVRELAAAGPVTLRYDVELHVAPRR
jgi:ubiquinone/menaquinone biosynthesis C-methylase UbiE